MNCTAERPRESKRVQRDAIAELVQRDRERSGGGSLMLVHRLAPSSRLARGTGDVEQDEHREVTSTAKARRCRPRRAGADRQAIDPCLDRGVDVDVVTLRLPPARGQLETEACKRPSEPEVVGQTGRPAARRRIALDHRAPVGSIGTAVHVPLGVAGAVLCECGNAFGGTGIHRHHGAATTSEGRRRVVRRGFRPGRTAVASPGRAEHASQLPPDRAAALDRTRETVVRLVGIVVIDELWKVASGRELFRRGSLLALRRFEHAARTNHTEHRRRSRRRPTPSRRRATRPPIARSTRCHGRRPNASSVEARQRWPRVHGDLRARGSSTPASGDGPAG